MGRRVFLHVGCPKTGTTALQHAMFEHSAELASHGLFYPAYRVDEHFLASVDLLGLEWGWGVDEEADGAWDLLAERVRASENDAIISHELLGRADDKQIARAVESLGEAEISVVLTARDLCRQIPAEYQELLKFRHSISYQEFLDCLRDPSRESEGAWPAHETWRHQDVPAIAGRWADAVGSENITIVTLPPPGAPRDELRRRFSQAVGLDIVLPAASDGSTENRSLGVAEVGLLRRFNEDYSDKLNDEDYADFARTRIAANASALGTPPLNLPPDDYEWVSRRSHAWVRALEAAPYRVVGDLNDLIPSRPREFVNPDAMGEAELLDTALSVLAGSAIDFGAVQQELVQSRRGRWAAAKTNYKRRVVLHVERYAVGQKALQVWRQRHRAA